MKEKIHECLQKQVVGKWLDLYWQALLHLFPYLSSRASNIFRQTVGSALYVACSQAMKLLLRFVNVVGKMHVGQYPIVCRHYG